MSHYLVARVCKNLRLASCMHGVRFDHVDTILSAQGQSQAKRLDALLSFFCLHQQKSFKEDACIGPTLRVNTNYWVPRKANTFASFKRFSTLAYSSG